MVYNKDRSQAGFVSFPPSQVVTCMASNDNIPMDQVTSRVTFGVTFGDMV